jgi:hypothetical protein
LACDKGAAVYTLACRLYSRKLPRTEQDICALLCSSRHDCGHGEDVVPPFQLAIAWARDHGITPAWLAAVKTFRQGLAPLKSAKASYLKSRASLPLLLDPEGKSSSRCWSELFRRNLANLPEAERASWGRFVTYMSTALGPKLPKHFDQGVRTLTELLGPQAVVARLDEWLPDANLQPQCKLETAGTYLLKNLVWLLLVLSEDPALATACDPLVERLSRLEFRPAERGKQVALACAVYFSRRTPEVGLKPLEKLLAWSLPVEKDEFHGIRVVVRAYKKQHGL